MWTDNEISISGYSFVDIQIPIYVYIPVDRVYVVIYTKIQE